MRSLRRPATVIGLLASCALAGWARVALADLAPKPAIDALAQPLIDQRQVVGMVVGLVTEQGTALYGYGKTAADGVTPDADTVFEIGSVTKVFTGIVLAGMALDKQVTLDEPVQKLLPANVKVPLRDDTPITLLHLTTHTSGLPRMPGNFHPRDEANPYADYPTQRMFDFLATHELKYKPGEHHEYSNFAVGLLGQALALRAGRSYEDLVLQRVCTPLGMSETRITLDAALRARLAPGHDAKGQRVANWDLVAFAPTGGLRSTARDMMRFVAANLDLTKTDLAPALRLAQQVHYRAGNNVMGLGWIITPNGQRLWHNGQTGGYHSFVGLVPGHKVGVVILTNTATMTPDELGGKLLDLLDRR